MTRKSISCGQTVGRHSRESGNPGANVEALALDPRFPHGTSPWAEGARGDGKLLQWLVSFQVRHLDQRAERRAEKRSAFRLFTRAVSRRFPLVRVVSMRRCLFVDAVVFGQAATEFRKRADRATVCCGRRCAFPPYACCIPPLRRRHLAAISLKSVGRKSAAPSASSPTLPPGDFRWFELSPCGDAFSSMRLCSAKRRRNFKNAPTRQRSAAEGAALFRPTLAAKTEQMKRKRICAPTWSGE